jgi:hypothetical protein
VRVADLAKRRPVDERDVPPNELRERIFGALVDKAAEKIGVGRAAHTR